MPSCRFACWAPWFASELKPRSLRPPMSVTRPTLRVAWGAAFAEPPVSATATVVASTATSATLARIVERVLLTYVLPCTGCRSVVRTRCYPAQRQDRNLSARSVALGDRREHRFVD